MREEQPTIDISEKGPFIVKNLKQLNDAQGQPVEMAKAVIALCRCGASKTKPFCDGTHTEIGFNGENACAQASAAEEPEEESSSPVEIVILEDGPLQVCGGIELNGVEPASKNQYFLCRCGSSKNKPFCDSSHKEIGFKG